MQPPAARVRRGGALIAVIFLGVALATLSLAALTLSSAAMRELQGTRRVTAARYVADAGLGAALFELRTGGDGQVGSADQPVDFGGGRFWVERQPMEGNLLSLVSTGEQNGAKVRLQLALRGEQPSIYRFGAFGDEQLTMRSNATIDSYDSDAGSYEDQADNGSGSHSYANENGTIGSNGGILLQQNARVYGDAAAGPDDATTIMGNAIVTGSTTPSAEELVLPPVEIPELPSLGPLIVPAGSTLTVASGTQAYDELWVQTGSLLLVDGPATLVFDSLLLDSNSEILVDATLGAVEFYIRRDFVLDSNTTVSSLTQKPADIAFFLASDNITDPELEVDLDDIDFDSNSKLYGTIYAPSAAIEIDSNFELFGAIIARRLVLDSNSKVHYDETLGNAQGGGPQDFETVAWRVISPHDPEGPH